MIKIRPIVKWSSGIACDWCASLDIVSILALKHVLLNQFMPLYLAELAKA